MAQHDMVLDNGPGRTVRTDMNAAVQALVTLSSGVLPPTTTYGGMLWLDTSGAEPVLRMRNIGNTDWVAPALTQFVEAIGDTMTGPLIIASSPDHPNPELIIDKESGISPNARTGTLRWRTAGTERWAGFTDSSEELGGNVGSNWCLARYDDGGVFIDLPFAINRQTGKLFAMGGKPISGTSISVSSAPPGGATPSNQGDYHFYTDTGQLYVSDGATWRLVAQAPPAAGYVSKAGDTMAGQLNAPIFSAENYNWHAVRGAAHSNGAVGLLGYSDTAHGLQGQSYAANGFGVVGYGNTGAWGGLGYGGYGVYTGFTSHFAAGFSSNGVVTLAGAATYLPFNANIAPGAGDANAVFRTSDGLIRRGTSSLRYKRDVETIADAIGDKVLALRPIRFRANELMDTPDPNWSWYGFAAEEVAKIDPRFAQWDYAPRQAGGEPIPIIETRRIVRPADPKLPQDEFDPEAEVEYDEHEVITGYETDDALSPLGFNQSGILAAVVNLVQRQARRIEDLEDRLAELEGEGLMAQSDYNVEDGPGLEVRSQINIILQSIVTTNSGVTEPAHMFPGMLWLDTSPYPATSILRMRNQQNSAWIVIWPAGATVLQSGALEITREDWGRSEGGAAGDAIVQFPEPFKAGTVPDVIVQAHAPLLTPGWMINASVSAVDETGFVVSRRAFNGTEVEPSDAAFNMAGERDRVMTGFLINLLIFIVIAGLIWWVIQQIPMPEPMGRIVRTIVPIIFAIILIMMFFGLAGHGPWTYGPRVVVP